MGFKDWFKIKESGIVELDYKPVLSETNSVINLTEQFKGEVEQKKIKFPDELGEEHPFDFATLEKLYKKFGFFTAVVDKYVDFIWGSGFYVKCKDERALTIIEDFMRDVNLDTLGRAWTKEALVKGNGFLEIGGTEDEGIQELKVLNANYMYVERDKFGKVEGYNQYTGTFNTFSKKKIISFTPKQIAHVPFNVVGDDAYGLGIGFPALVDSNNLLQNESSTQLFMKRKANAPLHAKLGKVDGDIRIVPKPEDVTAFGKKMEIMSQKTDWATDDLVDLSVIDFGNAGDRFVQMLEYDIQKLLYVFQIPAVLMGMARIPEGLARVQMEAFQRRIQSIQSEFEKIIEEQIFRKVLEANGFGVDVHCEFEWRTPSVLEIEGRMKVVTEIIKSPTTSLAMKTVLEDELINLLKLDETEWELAKVEAEKKIEEERKREELRPQPIVPGQNKKFPQPVPPKSKQPAQPKPTKPVTQMYAINGLLSDVEARESILSLVPDILLKEIECKHCEEGFFDEFNDIEEWLGFKYKDYLGEILKVLGIYDFEQLKAVNEIQLEAGMLSDTQVNTLRGILDDGFRKGKGMKEMAKQVDKKVGVKDLYRMTDGKIKVGASGLPILSKSAEKRSIAIIRSEVTRMANAGAKEYYKANDITQVTWIASIGLRTCPECEGYNGQIYEINDTPTIPAHPMCRCILSPVVELK